MSEDRTLEYLLNAMEGAAEAQDKPAEHGPTVIVTMVLCASGWIWRASCRPGFYTGSSIRVYSTKYAAFRAATKFFEHIQNNVVIIKAGKHE